MSFQWDETYWRELERQHEEYEMGRLGSGFTEELQDEAWEDQERRERHYDFIFSRVPARVSDDWEEAA